MRPGTAERPGRAVCAQCPLPQCISWLLHWERRCTTSLWSAYVFTNLAGIYDWNRSWDFVALHSTHQGGNCSSNCFCSRSFPTGVKGTKEVLNLLIIRLHNIASLSVPGNPWRFLDVEPKVIIWIYIGSVLKQSPRLQDWYLKELNFEHQCSLSDLICSQTEYVRLE